jgi:LAO/AO transport system kinase
VSDIQASSPEANTWQPPILRTVATEGTGVNELFQEVARHRQYLVESGEWQRRERLRLQSELDMLLQALLVSRWRQTVSQEAYQGVLDQLLRRDISPWQAVDTLLDGHN